MSNPTVRAAGKRRNKRRTSAFVRACALLAIVVTSLAGVSNAVAKTYLIVIEQMRFNPPVLTVHRGDRVMWVNKDLFSHTASAMSKAFDSREIAPNASWTYVARETGSYPYLCTLHVTMRGTVIVQ
ncbi:cupredoxin family copper-binding protein [Paraburkholderia phytofirmans]|uniref:cupredoxin domain-containing protein n=1 Tax=Paraburkholderia sp. BL9I2N2 TaxID=1938809 RepID=UPI0031780BD3